MWNEREYGKLDGHIFHLCILVSKDPWSLIRLLDSSYQFTAGFYNISPAFTKNTFEMWSTKRNKKKKKKKKN